MAIIFFEDKCKFYLPCWNYWKGRNYDPTDFEAFSSDGAWILEEEPPFLTVHKVEAFPQELASCTIKENQNDGVDFLIPLLFYIYVDTLKIKVVLLIIYNLVDENVDSENLDLEDDSVEANEDEARLGPQKPNGSGAFQQLSARVEPDGDHGFMV